MSTHSRGILSFIPRHPSRGWRGSGCGLAAATFALTAGVAGCAPAPDPARDGELRVVATTGILADLVRNVAGDRAHVTQMVPNGADPHSWEPSLRTIRDVAYADVAFSNYLMLEEHALIRALDSNLPAGSRSVSVAEEAAKNGATILPLVEDRALDTPWLGMRVWGNGTDMGATRASQIDLTTTGIDGPGQAAAYLTTSFGQPEIAFASSDGFNAAGGYDTDTAQLPADAHQHMSWAFTAPGVYRVHFRANLRTTPGATPTPVGEGTAVFAVGTPPEDVAAAEDRRVLSGGHADITVNLTTKRVELASDADALSGDEASAPCVGASSAGAVVASTMECTDLDHVVIEVPTRALTTIPGEASFRFIGEAGTSVYMLPQAVLGKHVHGDIDPHLWHDVHNAQAYVRVIRDSLISVDPGGEATYRTNAATYLTRLDQLDATMASTIATIPSERRKLVTTNDAYAYLANAYGLTVAGFVAPNPSVEPSIADRIKLQATLTDSSIPAVFLEPNLARTRSTLRTAATDAGVDICPLYGDTLDNQAPTYIDMMQHNARSLARCLGGKEMP